MKATDTNLIDLLEANIQYSIPIFQRCYSWDKNTCLRLFNDIIEIANDEKRPCHFLGSIIYLNLTHHVSKINKCLIVDGQQRITTISLLLLALSEYAKNDYFKNKDDYNNSEIAKFNIEHLIFNEKGKGDSRYRLKLSGKDYFVYNNLLKNRKVSKDSVSNNINKNYQYLYEQLKKKKINPDSLLKGIKKLKIIDMPLEKEDNAQLIFETVNSTGVKLSSVQMIKNYILMNVEPELQDKLYNDYWLPLEESLTTVELNYFFRYYLILKVKKIISLEYYNTFKEYINNSDTKVDDFVKEAKRYHEYYLKWKQSEQNNDDISKKISCIKSTRRDEIVPVIMQLLNDLDNKKCEKDDFSKLLDIVASYLVRTKICYPDFDSNKVFITFLKNMGQNNYLLGLINCIRNLPNEISFPKDEKIKEALHTVTIYDKENIKNQFVKMLLDQIESRLNPDHTPNSKKLTIEHIMPQSIKSHNELYSKNCKLIEDEKIKLDWEEDLGKDWERINRVYVNTLGNLTLSGNNQNLRNYRFGIKKDMDKGFKESTLCITSRYVANCDKWGEQEIINRSDALADIITDIWKYPSELISNDK